MWKSKDYTNKKFGKFTVICFTGKKQLLKNGSYRKVWKLKCDCGNEVERDNALLSLWDLNSQKYNHISCGCSLRKGIESVAYWIYYGEYSNGDITFEKFKELSQQDCYHCGSSVKETGSIRYVKGERYIGEYFQYHGLDRLDNNKEHTLDNVVPCCSICNFFRRERDLNSFYNKLKLIHANNVNIQCYKNVEEFKLRSLVYGIYKCCYADGDISFEQFQILCQQDCYYCGSLVELTGSVRFARIKKTFNKVITYSKSNEYIKYHGLDRIDNSRKHDINNVVPCCKDCNFLRGNKSLEDFLTLIRKITLRIYDETI